MSDGLYDDGSLPDPRRFSARVAEDSRKSAQEHLRRSRGGDARHLGGGGPEAVRQREGSQLLEWAKGCGRLLVPSLVDSIQFEQGEHQGFYDLASDRWIKLTLSGRAGYTLDAQEEVPGVRGRLETRPATPAEYLERLRLANEKFGDAIRFLGVVERNDGWCLVTSQPNVPGGPPSQREVEQFFRANGFRQINEKTWFRATDRLLIGDAHVANLKRTKQGDVVPFDLLICEARGALQRAVEAPLKLEF